MPMPLWFPPASLRALCDSGPWARGMDLFRGGKVRQLNVVPLDDHWLLEGEVQGSQPLPYEVSIEMGLMPNGEVDFWHGRCTCPVGRQCKHGVALMVHAAHQGAPVSTMKAQVAMPGRSVAGNTVRQEVQGRIAEIHRLEAETQLVNWLLALERAGVPAIGQAGKGREEGPGKTLSLLSGGGGPGGRPWGRRGRGGKSARSSPCPCCPWWAPHARRPACSSKPWCRTPRGPGAGPSPGSPEPR